LGAKSAVKYAAFAISSEGRAWAVAAIGIAWTRTMVAAPEIILPKLRAGHCQGSMWAQSQKSFGPTFTPISIIKSDFELGQNGFPCACYASLPQKLYRSGSAKRSFTPMAEGFFYLFDGYIYGLKATAALDTRRKALSDFGYKDVSAMVLTFCSKNPGGYLD
jgi:hypothetical protein